MLLQPSDENLPQIAEKIIPKKAMLVFQAVLIVKCQVSEIEGCDFIGLIEVPSYGIKLPIYSEFEYYIPKVYSRNNNGSLVIEVRYSENQFSFADYIYRPILQYISL